MDNQENETNKIPKTLGAVEDEPDNRDFVYEDHIYGKPEIKIDWEEEFDLEEIYGYLHNDDQDGLLDCVGEGSSNDVEMDVLITTGKKVHLSAKDIYRGIVLISGGASPRDAYKRLNKVGVCEYDLMPTLAPNGSHSKSWARSNNEETPRTIKNALQYRIGPYYSIRSYEMDVFARAIMENGGVGGGYRGYGVNIGHFIFFKGFGMHNGYKGLKYKDSIPSGNNFDKWIIKHNGKFYLDSSRGSQVQLFSHWTFKHGQNYPFDKSMVKLVRKRGTKRVYLQIGGERIWIKSPHYFNLLRDNQPLKDIEWEKVKIVDRFTSINRGALIGQPNLAKILALFGKVKRLGKIIK